MSDPLPDHRTTRRWVSLLILLALVLVGLRSCGRAEHPAPTPPPTPPAECWPSDGACHA